MGKPKTPKRNSFSKDGTSSPVKKVENQLTPIKTEKQGSPTSNKSSPMLNGKTPKKTPGKNTPKQNFTPKQGKHQTPKGNAGTPGASNKRKSPGGDDLSPGGKKQKLHMFAGTKALGAGVKTENVKEIKAVSKSQAIPGKQPNLQVHNFKRMREVLQKGGGEADTIIKRLKAKFEGGEDSDPQLRLSKKNLCKLLRIHPLTKNLEALQPMENQKQNEGKKGAKKLATKSTSVETKPKKQKKKPVPVKTELTDEEESGDSEYNVETTIKPERISKEMNEDDDEDDSDGDEEIDSDGQLVDPDDDQNDESDAEEDEDDDSEDVTTIVKVDKKSGKKQQQKEKKAKQGVAIAEKDSDDGKNKKNKNKKKKPSVESVAADLNEQGISQKGQSRYVAFAGNLPYSVTKETLVEHFSKAGPVKHIRLPTEKGTNKPRGFAFIEYNNSEDYQKALSLHNTFVEGRKINVLYTQGGKKKSSAQKGTIKAKNMKLKAMREKGMLTGAVKESQKRAARRNKKKKLEAKKEGAE